MTDTAHIIAQLERERSALDNAIEALRNITGETATEKQTPNGATKQHRGRSSEGRQRQIEAMRKYWAGKKAGEGAAQKATKKKSMSAASRKRMAAAQRKRWAEVRRSGSDR